MQQYDQARLLGLVGGALYLVGSLLDAVTMVAFGALHPSTERLATISIGSVDEFVVGILVLGITIVTNRARQRHALWGGILLIVLAIVAWVGLGLDGIFGLLGGLLAFLAGVLYLIPPYRRAYRV
ncbi:MAG: hypothetical protein L3J93_05285 [Thermoplasmata archaeon]|nr:hypothetical protein [Thermoplasmata archaeon]